MRIFFGQNKNRLQLEYRIVGKSLIGEPIKWTFFNSIWFCRWICRSSMDVNDIRWEKSTNCNCRRNRINTIFNILSRPIIKNSTSENLGHSVDSALICNIPYGLCRVQHSYIYYQTRSHSMVMVNIGNPHVHLTECISLEWTTFF